ASFNFHSIEYTNYREFTESGYDPASSLQLVYFDNLMGTYGNAVSFNVGGIAKIRKMFRVGISYQSPVWWYKLTDELSQRISSNIPDGDLTTINFNLVNIFPDYKIQHPGKITGSVAAIFGKHGLISFDYDYQDFSKSRLKPESDPYFELQNTLIGTRLKAVSTYRIGAEVRFFRNKQLGLRGGYRIQESPYTNGTSIGDLQGYSFGLGYDFGGTQIDASFNRYTREELHQLFDPGFPNTTRINSENTNVTLSLSFKL
ncbi:MAG: outer membrane protein transport protein, partial [Sinomicrobium sp.]|nr:outer membrane protein transport protein [Sinomicrobium sp.]